LFGSRNESNQTNRTTKQTRTTSRSPRVLAIRYTLSARCSSLHALPSHNAPVHSRRSIPPFPHAPPCGFLRPLLEWGPPSEAPMSFSIRPFRRFLVHCSVSYNAGPLAKAPCGIAPIPAGLFPAICPCDQGKPSRSPSHSRMSNASRSLKRLCDG
jgi:hypothetical protein